MTQCVNTTLSQVFNTKPSQRRGVNVLTLKHNLWRWIGREFSSESRILGEICNRATAKLQEAEALRKAARQAKAAAEKKAAAAKDPNAELAKMERKMAKKLGL